MMTSVQVCTVRLKRLHPGAQVPAYAHVGPYGDMGADLFCVERTSIDPWTTRSVPTGIALEFPPGVGAVIEDRSGIASKGLTTLAGVVDPGYRGEIKVVMTNLSDHPVSLNVGDRIAQLRLVSLIQASFVEVEELQKTPRSDNGFGSTGK
jgi:dUTP pyrophosphatase